MPLAPCPRCGALVPDIDGPVHKYVPSSPGCWRALGEVQADEMARFGYPAAHRLVVDAYMAQHPGDGGDRRDRQSVFVHLVGLCAQLEQGLLPQLLNATFKRVLGQLDDLPVLRRSGGPGELTVLHMVGASDAEDYAARAQEWAQAVWGSWMASHERIRRALPAN